MKTLELIKIGTKSLTNNELDELQALIIFLKSKDPLHEMIIEMWNNGERINSIKYYRNHPSHIIEPTLEEARSFVEQVVGDSLRNH